ncbi:MAG: hypothetical protein QOI76_765 [Frankiales bacterium]|nr:hypothetical protein [Frankiales bacterium]
MPRRASDALGVPVLAAIGLQLAYPLTHGTARDRITTATVVVVAAASVGHATLTRGRRGLAGCVVAAGVGLSAEVVGVHTGVPFGDYSYSGSLGWQVAGVPIIAGLAWTMLAWPAALVARRLAGSAPVRVLIGGWALASWDLFLDPQMVAAGHWHWAHTSPGLQGIPLTNYLGWLGVSILLVGVLHSLVPRTGSDTQPLTLYLWTYGSSVLANVAFFGRPAVALTGGIGMGLVALPLLRRLR